MKIIALSLGLVCAAGAASAQDGWNYALSSYMWFPDTLTGLHTPYGRVESELSVSDALDNLDFGVMMTGTAQRGDWSFVGDLVYLDIDGSQKTPFGVLFSEARVATKLTSVSTYALYRAYEGPVSSFDIGGGLRAMRLETDLSLEPGTEARRAQNTTDAWADALIAVKYQKRFGENWDLGLSLDYGGFDLGESSHKTWQAVATVGYRFDEKWSAVLGYRHLKTERTNDGADYDLELSGPVLGVAYRF